MIEQLILAAAAGFVTGAGTVYRVIKRKAANISEVELEQLMALILTAVEDGKLTKIEVITLVKTILKFVKD